MQTKEDWLKWNTESADDGICCYSRISNGLWHSSSRCSNKANKTVDDVGLCGIHYKMYGKATGNLESDAEIFFIVHERNSFNLFSCKAVEKTKTYQLVGEPTKIRGTSIYGGYYNSYVTKNANVCLTLEEATERLELLVQHNIKYLQRVITSLEEFIANPDYMRQHKDDFLSSYIEEESDDDDEI